MGGDGVAARGVGEVGGEWTAGAGWEVEEGRGMVWSGSRCWVDGLVEGGAEVGGFAEELEEGFHGLVDGGGYGSVDVVERLVVGMFIAALLVVNVIFLRRRRPLV